MICEDPIFKQDFKVIIEKIIKKIEKIENEEVGKENY